MTSSVPEMDEPTVPPAAARANGTVAVLLVAAAALGLVAHAATYMPFFEDDALISVRYAARLAAGRGLTWNDGERVEGYSDLLWVLLLAVPARLGLDPILAARALGMACAIAAMAVVAWVLSAARSTNLVVAFALVLCASTGSFAAWTIGGLEQPLVAMLLTSAVAALWPGAAAAPRTAGVLLALLCLTRPDGPVFVAGLALGHLGVRGTRGPVLRELAQIVAPSVAAVVAQELFRVGYYGDWVPNTARVKVAWHAVRRAHGARFVAEAMVAHAVPIAIMLAAALASAKARAPRTPLALLAPPLTLWAAYLAAMGGGGTYPAWRHVAPVVPLLALGAAAGLSSLAAARIWQVAPLGLVAALVHFGIQRADPFGALALAKYSDVIVYAQASSEVLQRTFGDREPTIGVTAAGGVPWFTGWRGFDLHGLTDREIALHRPADIGAGWMGHELCDADVVFHRAPDLIMLGMPRGHAPEPQGFEAALARDPRWSEYVGVFLRSDDTADPRPTLVWVRSGSARLGVRQRDDRVDIPPWLLGSAAERPVLASADGRACAQGTAALPARAPNLAIADGTWRATVDSVDPVRVRVLDVTTGQVLAEGPAPLDVTTTGAVTFELRPETADVACVRSVSLERTPP